MKSIMKSLIASFVGLVSLSLIGAFLYGLALSKVHDEDYYDNDFNPGL